jgi:hypothetical protein
VVVAREKLRPELQSDYRPDSGLPVFVVNRLAVTLTSNTYRTRPILRSDLSIMWRTVKQQLRWRDNGVD